MSVLWILLKESGWDNDTCFDITQVLHNSLSCLPLLLASLDSLSSPRCNNRQLMSMSKMANAALCALGGFTEMIKPGCEVKVTRIFLHDYKKFSIKFTWSEFYVIGYDMILYYLALKIHVKIHVRHIHVKNFMKFV